MIETLVFLSVVVVGIVSSMVSSDSSGDFEVNTIPKRRRTNAGSTSRAIAGSSDTIGNDLTPPKQFVCRFCKQIFAKSQSLGGHMNKHRAEKGEESIRNAQTLVLSKQDLYSPHRWTDERYGNHMNGQVGQSYHWPNQPTLQNPSVMNPAILPPPQTAQTLQGGQTSMRGNYQSSYDNTRAQQAYSFNPAMHTQTFPPPNQAGPSQVHPDMGSNNPQVQASNVHSMHQTNMHIHSTLVNQFQIDPTAAAAAAAHGNQFQAPQLNYNPYNPQRPPPSFGNQPLETETFYQFPDLQGAVDPSMESQLTGLQTSNDKASNIDGHM